MTVGRILTIGHNFHEMPCLSRKNWAIIRLRSIAEMWQGKGAGAMGNMPPAKRHSSTDLVLSWLFKEGQMQGAPMS
jgi:hypothetical protein